MNEPKRTIRRTRKTRCGSPTTVGNKEKDGKFLPKRVAASARIVFGPAVPLDLSGSGVPFSGWAEGRLGGEHRVGTRPTGRGRWGQGFLPVPDAGALPPCGVGVPRIRTTGGTHCSLERASIMPLLVLFRRVDASVRSRWPWPLGIRFAEQKLSQKRLFPFHLGDRSGSLHPQQLSV